MHTRRTLLAAGTLGIAALSGCTEFVTGEGPLSERAELAVVDEATLAETGYELVEQDTETISEEVEVAGQQREIEAVNQLSIYERAIDLGDGLPDEIDSDADLDDEEFDGDDLDDEDLDEFDDEDLPDDIDEADIPDGVRNGVTVGTTEPVAPLSGATVQADDEQGGSLFVLFSTPAFSIAGQSFSPVGSMDNAELAELLSSEIDELTVGEQVDETTRTVLGAETTVTTFDATASSTGETVEMTVELTAVDNADDYVIGLAAYPQLLDATEADNAEQLFDSIDHPAE